MTIVKPKKSLITYVFGFGRSNLISSNKNYADEFFYGYFHFKNEFNDVEYIEFENNVDKKIINRVLLFISKVLRKISKLSFFIENICTFKNFKKLLNTKNIIITNDRMGLSLLPFLIIYKLFRVNKSSVIVMGLLAKETNNILSHAIQRTFLNLFFLTVDRFIFLSKSEWKQAKVSYKKFRNKFYFVPFCIDTDFWKPNEPNIPRKKIIFIGNDGRREYGLVNEIARELPEYEFTFVTSEIKKDEIKSKNISLYEGSWNKQVLTDYELKDIYSEAKLSIIPIKNSYQPSGQSVALQSMSMNVPVMITDTVGFWDKEIFSNNENIYFIKKNTLNTWVKNIKLVLADNNELNRVSKKSKKIVEEKYNSKFLYSSLKKIVLNEKEG